ncbi:MAG: Hsp20/alpha crystallin family protein [Porticoccaceae bacterium]
MSSRDMENWMWSEAVRMLDRAERMQRHFLQPGSGNRPCRWEPPVDVYETDDRLWVVAALPGVAAERISVQVQQGVLIVAGERRLPEAVHRGRLHRVEIPAGRFERRLVLPPYPLELAHHELLDGCLYLGFRKL